MFSNLVSKLKNNPTITPTEKLLRAMKIGGKDLDLNRTGEISPLQKERMNRSFGCGCVGAACYALFFGGLMIVGFTSLSDRPWVLAGFALLVLVPCMISRARHRKKLATGHVIAFTGCARKHGNLLLIINYTDRVERIVAAGDSYGAFLEGETYTVYAPSFSPAQIIAAEHVPDAHV